MIHRKDRLYPCAPLLGSLVSSVHWPRSCLLTLLSESQSFSFPSNAHVYTSSQSQQRAVLAQGHTASAHGINIAQCRSPITIHLSNRSDTKEEVLGQKPLDVANIYTKQLWFNNSIADQGSLLSLFARKKNQYIPIFCFFIHALSYYLQGNKRRTFL